ncbi:Nsun6 protein [Salpingoeca rosetta]|uniref:Nsun6 protein n=1 Tax=Salpingoeca rosetta (strain ATCC 50818 / BSB-021) TaxID=946362 RepID=F2UFC8_SALR5|nr:Nsun6 protein [Salpingoeca rosetta]EGD75328.1 Nsun6 protein [Salpingoeca rosetta]|eukprot:XP_004992381.1 Nsun6 protein [Salpingoeca rosetta]
MMSTPQTHDQQHDQQHQQSSSGRRCEFRDDVAEYLEEVWDRSASGQRFADLCERLAIPPAHTCLRINTLVNTREEAIQTLARELEGTDYKFEQHPKLDDVLILPAIGPRRVVPDKEGLFVVVDAACGAAVLRGSDVFVPGIRACSSGVHSGARVAVYADVHKACSTGQTKLPPAEERAAKKIVFVGNGIAHFDRADVFRSSDAVTSGLGVEMGDIEFQTPCLGHLDRSLVLQNLPSCVASHVLAPQPGEHVVDMCAAPGGKTAHIAALMNNTGRITAYERSTKRCAALVQWLETVGVTCCSVFKMDARKCCLQALPQSSPSPSSSSLSSSSSQAVEKKKVQAGSVDRVLLDAPCTGLGQRPKFEHATPLTDVIEAPSFQKKLFRTAVALLKPGGTLVYSTCSFNPEENEGVVAWALAEFPHDIEIAQQVPYIGEAGVQYEGLSEEARQRVQRFTPSSTCDTIGFFIAKFIKKPPNPP